MKTYRSAKTMIGLVFLAGLLTPAPSAALAASTTTFGGQATAVRATVAVAGIAVGPLSLADTGPVDSKGDARDATILLPNGLGAVIINEHKTARKGDITVNALHIVIVGGTDVVVSSAHADIACGEVPPPPCAQPDFVTGGGWITTSMGSRANFAVA